MLDTARFANTPLEKLKGEIYGLCKDQHGCRFLQKKLEDRKPESVELIFEEVNEHVIELMTGRTEHSGLLRQVLTSSQIRLETTFARNC